MSARILGFVIAFISFWLDQAFKSWMLFGFNIEAKGTVPLTSFFDLVLVWNRGISYGLLQQDSELGRWALIGLALAASVFLGIWNWRNRSKLVAVGLGLVLGGALANGLDRILYGAVVDLFHFHWGDFSWYVFNLADAGIVAGAAILVYDSFFGADQQSGRNDAANS